MPLDHTIGTTGAVRLIRDGAIARVTLDRPDSRVNALSAAVIRDLVAAARSFEDDAETAVVILRGKPSIFSGGFDLKDRETHGLADAPLAARRVVAELGGRMLEAWWSVAPVTIAAVEGPCLGGGLVLAATLDFRVAGQGARFGAPELERGLAMGWSSLPRLQTLLGLAATRRIVLAGGELDAQAALAAGFVEEVAAQGAATDAALRLAATLARRPTAQLRMAKRAINAVALGGAAAVALDADQAVAAAASPEFTQTLAAFRDPSRPR